MCVSSETSLPEIVCSPVLDQKEWPRLETLEWLETSTGWYQLDVFFLIYFPNDGFLVNPHRPTPYLFSQSQLLQERRSCHAAGQVDATRGFHGGNLYLQDWHLVKKKKWCAAKHANCNGSSTKAKMLFVNILNIRGCSDKRYSCHQLSLSSKVQVSARQNSICT